MNIHFKFSLFFWRNCLCLFLCSGSSICRRRSLIRLFSDTHSDGLFLSEVVCASCQSFREFIVVGIRASGSGFGAHLRRLRRSDCPVGSSCPSRERTQSCCLRIRHELRQVSFFFPINYLNCFCAFLIGT